MYNYYFLMSLLVIILSCQTRSKNDVINSPVIDSISAARVSAKFPSNSENPYDSVGYIHNECLKFVRGCLPRNAGYPQLKECIGKYFYKVRKADVSKALDRIPEDMGKRLQKDYRSVVFTKQVPAEMKDKLQELFTAIDSSKSLNFSVFKKNITAFEKQINAEKGLSEKNKKILLGAASTARYSAFYWWTEHGNGSVQFENFLSDLVEGLFVVIGDVCGFVLGSFFGESEADVIATADDMSNLAYWTMEQYYGY